MSPYMYTFFVALLPLTAFALPKSVATSSVCSKDAVYLQLAAPLIASAASNACTTYIRSTVSATTTVTQSATATATQTLATATVIQKRAPTLNLAALAPSALLSSACSCLLVTASPPPTTVYPYTQTVTMTVATVTKTQDVIETCASAAFTSPIQNGDFSQGQAFWSVNSTAEPGCGNNPTGYCFDQPGAVFYSGDPPITSTLYQTLVTCAGAKYQATITFKSEFCGGQNNAQFAFTVDDQVLIDGANQACGEGVYPNLDGGPYHTLTANFTAQSNSPLFAVDTSGYTNVWHIENIVIAPVQG